MNKTLRISFALKNTYRVNSILYSLKQIPLIKRLLPDSLYQVQGLKIFANILSVLWEILSTFIGKILYMLIMVLGVVKMNDQISSSDAFLHILFFLTIIGVFANTYIFNPSRDKYYAMILMRMNAKEYTIVNYGYSILKVILGFLVVGIFFGRLSGISLGVCLLIPFFVAGLKVTYAAYSLRKYEKTKTATSENNLGKIGWVVMFLLLALAYGPILLGVWIPKEIVIGIMVFSIVMGAFSVKKIIDFDQYHPMYQEILAKFINQIDAAKENTRKITQKQISTVEGITSEKEGFEYLNELFIKRHQKILWKSAKHVAAVSFVLILAVLVAFYILPEMKVEINKVLMRYLPYFVFVMYLINRGTGFTRALFMNCDHSLLTYSFYKQPKFVLKLFRLRLREIIKINLFPASIIGIGLAAILFASGGTENMIHYVVIIVSILCMSVFFSVHYLIIYYLLQPYNAGTEIKSATYQIILSVTYLFCFMMTKVQMSTLVFGMMTIVFCVIYCIVACILVYKIGPKTFKLRT